MKELEKQVELYEKNIESQQQSLETLKRELEQLKEETHQPWKPKDWEVYYFITPSGFVNSSTWNECAFDRDRYAIGNVFRTKEEAEFKVEKLKVEAELKRFARPFKRGEANWIIKLDSYANEFEFEYWETYMTTDINFATKEIAQQAIDTVGEERIKKYYFGVVD